MSGRPGGWLAKKGREGKVAGRFLAPSQAQRGQARGRAGDLAAGQGGVVKKSRGSSKRLEPRTDVVCKVQTDAYRRTVQNGVIEALSYVRFLETRRLLWGIAAQKRTQRQGQTRSVRKEARLSLRGIVKRAFKKEKNQGTRRGLRKKNEKKRKGLGDPSPIYFLGLLAGGGGVGRGRQLESDGEQG